MLTYNHLKLKPLLLTFATLAAVNSTNAVAEWMQPQSIINMGTVVPSTGNCTFDPITLVMSSPSDLCTGGEALGHAKIFGPANQMQKIKLHPMNDTDTGIRFDPKGRLVNNLGDDMSAPTAGGETWIRIGSDGVLDIYIGGTLTLSQKLSSNFVASIEVDIEYNRP